MSKQGKPELENMKFEVAREYGIDLKRGYNGDPVSYTHLDV